MSSSYLRPVTGNVAFNAHHSPMGAFFSFTCGHDSMGGGLAAEAPDEASEASESGQPAPANSGIDLFAVPATIHRVRTISIR